MPNIINDYLNSLYALTLVEENRELTADEIKQYMFYVEALKDANIKIPFGIEY